MVFEEGLATIIELNAFSKFALFQPLVAAVLAKKLCHQNVLTKA